MTTPLVSVCIPTYNMGAFIGQATDSVLMQTVEDFEIVVCDNASTDNTGEVMARYGNRRVRYIVNEANVGMYGNFNRTLHHSRERFVKFLCADDQLEPAYLEKALSLFTRHPSVGVVTALQTVVDDSGLLIARHAPRRRRGPEIRSGGSMLRRAPWRHSEVGTPSHAMLRREVFDLVGLFDTALGTVNDWEMSLRVFSRYDVGFLRDSLVVIRHHAGQGSMAQDAALVSVRDVVRLADARYAAAPTRRRRLLLLRSGEVYLWQALTLFDRGDRVRATQLMHLVRHRFAPGMLAA